MGYNKLHLYWLFTLVCCLSTVHIGYCQDTESETTPERERDPIEEGMDPLYKMTVTFLDVIHPESKGNLLEVILDEDVELGDWKVWTKRYVGYLVCAAIGVVFVVVMPIVGLCICCCRTCCGNCGGKPKEKRGKHHKCQMVACSIIFAVLNIVILAGMVCTFVTNELLRQQTSQAEDAVVPTIVSSLERLETFKEQIITDLDDQVIKRAVEEIDRTLQSLGEVPAAVTTAISTSSGYDEAIVSFEELVARTVEIDISLDRINTLQGDLMTNAQTLSTKLNDFKNTFSTSTSSCGSCSSIRNDVDNLSVDSTDIGNLPDLNPEITNINAVMNNDLPNIINEGKAGLTIITTAIYNSTNVIIGLSTVAVDALNTEISKAGDDLEEKLNDQITLQKQIDQVKSYEDDVEEYGDYRFYAGIVLCCVLLLILLFSILGALFGTCGSPPSEDASACNKGVGANLLMASVGFTFLFCWLMMLVVLILFLLGGLVHTEVCRVVVDLEDSSAIEIIDKTIEDNVVSKNGSSSISFKFSDILSDCKNDQPVYQVLNLGAVVNLTDILNLDNYDIREEVEKLQTVNVSLPLFDLYTDDMKTQLDNLKAAGLDGIDFNKFSQLIESDILTGDLIAVSSSIDEVAASQTGSLKTTLEGLADDLTDIADTELNNVQLTLASLKQEATKCVGLIDGSTGKTYSDQVTDIQMDLKTAEEDTENNWVQASSSALVDVSNDIIDDVQVFLNDLIDFVESDFARCGPIYNALDDSIHSVCVSMLEPFNGFWFSFGWCLFFFIPCIIVALNLVGLYRVPAVDNRYRDNNKSFDDPNFDAYAGGDNPVPLQERYGDRYGNGNQNTGYQRDDYTASRAGNYRADAYPDKQYDPGYQQRGYQGAQSNQGHGYAANAPSQTPPNPPHYHNGSKYYQ